MRIPLRIILLIALVAGCASAALSASSLPPGDANRGAELFTQSVNGAPTCASCHSLDGSSSTGPSLKGLSAVASTRVTNTSASDYIYASIVRPAEYIVSGYSNVMFGQYEQSLTTQQIADLVAYLLKL